MENLPSYSSFINSPRSSEETNADKLPSYSSFINGTPPEEVGVVHGIARGLKTGLTQDLPSAVGKAMQFVGAEEAGKSLTAFAEQNAVPEDQQGYWEKGARAIGAVLPMILAGAVAPVAGVVAGVAGGAIFGLSQAHETEKALKERGIEPGIAPYLTGGATAAAMTLLPILTGKIFNGPIANLVGKELSKQTAESVIRPSAGKILQDYGIKALETQLIFAGQTLSVAGIEKAYGVPREIASEMLESAKTGIVFSAFAAPGMAVRRAVDSSHLKTLANPWKPEDVASMPEQLQGKYLQRHAENRSGYAEAIGNALEKGGDPDTAKLWHDYAYKQIEKNEPIDTGMTLDPINLKAKLLEREVLDTSTTIKKGDAGENIGEVTVEKTPEPAAEEAVSKPILPIEETLAEDKGNVPPADIVEPVVTAEAKAAISPSTLKELNLSPALSVDGEIFKAGENHGDIYNSVPKEKLESAKDLQTGYVDQTGKWYTDQQAREVISVIPKPEEIVAPVPEIKAAEPVLTEEQKKTAELEDKRQKASEDLVAFDRDKPQKPKKGASVQEEAAYQNKLKDWKAAKEPLQKAMNEIDTTITASRETPEQKIAKDVNDALAALGKETDLDKIGKLIAAYPEENAAQITKRIVQSLPTKAKTVKIEAEPAAKVPETTKGKGTAEVKAKIAADKVAKEEAAVVERKAGTEKRREELSITTEPDHMNYILSDYISRLQQGEGGGKKGTKDFGEDVWLGSGYPEFYQDMVRRYGNKKTAPILTKKGEAPGIDADRLINIIDKGMKGKELTPGYQQQVWEDINRIADREATSGEYKGVLDQIREATNEWTGEKARLTEEGADSGAVGAHIETATETLRSDLEAKGYSPEDVDQVIRELKTTTLGKKETPKGESDLISEARKYKSAEEFWQADHTLPLESLTPATTYEKWVKESGGGLPSLEPDKPIVVIMRDGKNLIADGVHRYFEHLQTGDKNIKVVYSKAQLADIWNKAQEGKGNFKQAEIPEVKAKEDILSNPETEWSKPLSEQEVVKNHDMFGTEEGLKKVAKDYADKTPDDKVTVAEDILKNDKITEEKGKITRDLCNGGK